MLIRLKLSIKIIVFLVYLLSISLLFPLIFASGKPENLMILGVTMNPKPAKLGDVVSIRFTMKNICNESISCIVSACCEGDIIDAQEVTIGPRSQSLLIFELNTSDLNTGIYSIESLVKYSADRQEVFNLGNLQVGTESTTSDSFDIPPLPLGIVGLLSATIIIGALIFGLILKKRRKTNQDQVIPLNQVSNDNNSVDPDEKIASLFNEILKVDEQKVEAKTLSDDEEERQRKKYIKIARARALLED